MAKAKKKYKTKSNKKVSKKKASIKKTTNAKQKKITKKKKKASAKKVSDRDLDSEEEVIKTVVESILKSFIVEHDSRNYTTVEGNIDIFKRHLEGTYVGITSTLKPTIKTKKEKEIELLNFILSDCEITGSGKSVTFGIPIEQYSKYKQIEKDYNKFYTACTIIPKSSIIMLISHFDCLLGRLVQCLYNSKPEFINLSEKQISMSQLYNFGSLKAAKEYFLEKEIESLLRKSHSEQFDWLENKFDINLRSNAGDWSEFIELTERRNLYVHTNGKVSSQYLQVCKKNGVKLNGDIKVGDYLEADLGYFKKSYHLIYKLGIQLSHVLWRKILPDQYGEADINYNQITYELLKEGEYSLAIELLDFLFETPPMQRFKNEYIKLSHLINRAQAYKWSGDKEKCKKLLEGMDWSSSGDSFKLAVAVLESRYETAVSVMKKIGSKDKVVDKNAYLEWPLFKNFRKTKKFRETFKEIFGTSDFKIKDGK